MEQWHKNNLRSMGHQESIQWRHLILKLRWIGLEDEAQCLELAVGTIHPKEEMLGHADPPILGLGKPQTRKEERTLVVATEGKRSS